MDSRKKDNRCPCPVSTTLLTISSIIHPLKVCYTKRAIMKVMWCSFYVCVYICSMARYCPSLERLPFSTNLWHVHELFKISQERESCLSYDVYHYYFYYQYYYFVGSEFTRVWYFYVSVCMIVNKATSVVTSSELLLRSLSATFSFPKTLKT